MGDFNSYSSTWQSEQTIAFLKHEQINYAADGGNAILSNFDMFEELLDTMEYHIKLCSYMQQTKADHCGSSAVIIALEFIRNIKNQEFPRAIVMSNKDTMNRLINSLQKDESATLDLPPLHIKRIFIECPYCGKLFKKKNSLILHKEDCRNQNVI